MNDHNHEPIQERRRRQNPFHFDALLVVFLLLSWPLIFATATMALRRDHERWLEYTLIPQSSADYSPDPNAPKLALVKPQIIQEVKADEQRKEATRTPDLAVMLPDITPTATVSPTASPTPSGNLVVSAGGPYQTDEGSPATLTATGFNSVLSILPGGITYLWDLDGDSLYDDAQGVSTQITFYDEGDYPVAVRASDLFGRSAVDLTRVTVDNVPPRVVLGPDQSAEEGQEISLLAEASDPGEDILLYEWDFGDGSPLVNGTLEPNHTYRDDGEYLVRLRVSDNDGGVTEAFMAVDVVNLPPLVDAGPNQSVDEGDTITFSGTATDPADDASALSYAWDFDYDGETFTPDATGAVVSTVYEDGPAERVAALRVEDKDGGFNIATTGVNINNVPPVITGVSHNGPIDEGSFLDIQITATDAGERDNLTYSADFGGSGMSNSSGSFSERLYEDGETEVSLRVDDGDGGEAFTTTLVSVNNLTPTAVARLVTSAPIDEGEEVIFDGSGSSDPGRDTLTYVWDFGDNTPVATGVEAVHTYADDGQYNVTLTVRDEDGAFDTASVAVTVLNAKPTINTMTNREVDEGSTINYEGRAQDPGLADVPTLEYSWDFDYDADEGFEVDATGRTVSTKYEDGPADIVVALQVEDDEGAVSDPSLFEVKVSNVAPTANIEDGDHSKDQNEPIELKGSATDPSSLDALSLTYSWDLDDDGTCDDATGQTITHAWSEMGEHIVWLCVTDKDGDVGRDDTPVNINAQPIVVITPSITSTLEGSPITFDGRGSRDPDGEIDLYEWNFGDGTIVSGDIPTFTHVYSDNNGLLPYTVSLTVTDDDASVTTGAITVTVGNANPLVYAGPDRTVAESTAITLTGVATDPGSLDQPALVYQWDFSYDGVTFTPEATENPVSWPGADGPATITVALRVTDKDLGSRIDTALITVNNVAPLVNAGGPYTGTEGLPVTLTGSAIDPSDTLTYFWDLDNNGTFETPGQIVSNTWSSGGLYTVGLQVTDDDGAVGQATATVDINFIPTVDAGGLYSGDEATTISFTGSGSDPDGDSLTYTWNFGDGMPPQTGTTPTASHTYADNGIYTVSLRANDGNGGIIVATTTVTISNLPPTAAASADPNPAPEGTDITFGGAGSDDPAPGDTLSYAWDFGDGVQATGVTVTHRYDDNNTYTATLTVDDGDDTDSIDIVVTVLNENPTADAGGPYRTTLGVPITLSGSGSDVPDDTLTYEWDLDNDGTFETSGQTTSATWPAAGNQTVALRVSDEDGGVAIDTASVDVGSPPNAEAGGPYAGDEGSAIDFDGSGSDDPEDDPLTYAWDFDNDGTFDATGVNPSHTYADDGSYTVVLRVEDDRGGVDTTTVPVTVNNVAPSAAAAAGPNPVAEGTVVNFDASGSTDPADALSYSWDFESDGTFDANGINVTHTYPDEGDYTVTLLVDDGDGGTASDNSLIVTVTNAPPVAAATANPNSVPEETPDITFDASGSTDPGSSDSLSYSWDFGDGNSATGANPSHTYADSGDYTVTLTVTDDDGASDTETLTVTVNNSPPTADAGGPYSTTAGNPVQLDGSGSDIAADPLDYNWDLDDNGSFETNGQSVTFTPLATGTYTVTLEVRDDDGGVTTDTATVDVNMILPLVWLGPPLLLRRRKLLTRSLWGKWFSKKG